MPIAIGNAIGERLASGSQQKPALTFDQDRRARQADPYNFGDLANYKYSNGFESKQSFSAVDTYTAEDRRYDQLVLGERMAALAAPQAPQSFASSSSLPFTYLATDGTGHMAPQAPVVVEGQRLMALPELDHSGYFATGFVTSSYQQAVGMMADRNAPWYERGGGFVAATLMAPTMLAEEAGRAALNVRYHARQAGQYAAQFMQARTTDERVLAGLSFVSNGASAFVGTAPVIPSSVSLRPVMTAQEMAVAQFPGAEATAAARATYRNAQTVNMPDPVQVRLQELITEGHGIQRHGAQVTGVQLEGRAVEGLDPMTGTRVDGVHGGAHQYAQHATKVVSDEAYVFAEAYGRNSQQFLDETLASSTGRVQLKIPLKDIYGEEFREFVTGTTRYGPKASPTGFGNTIFSDNAYMAIRYKQDPYGSWKFNTMFPQPE